MSQCYILVLNLKEYKHFCVAGEADLDQRVVVAPDQEVVTEAPDLVHHQRRSKMWMMIKHFLRTKTLHYHLLSSKLYGPFLQSFESDARKPVFGVSDQV